MQPLIYLLTLGKWGKEVNIFLKYWILQLFCPRPEVVTISDKDCIIVGRCPKYSAQTVPSSPFLVVVKVSAPDEPFGEDLRVGLQEEDGVGRADVGLKVARLLHVRRVAVNQEALQGKEDRL